MTPRWVKVTRDERDPEFPVLISLWPNDGGQVTELRLSKVEMVELAKGLDLMCCDSGLISVSRRAAGGNS